MVGFHWGRHRPWVRSGVGACGIAGGSRVNLSPARKILCGRREEQLLGLWTEAARASWIQSTYITGDTQILAALASKRAIEAAAKLAKDSAGFETADLPRELARKLELLRLSLTLAVPPDPKASEELTRLVTAMESRVWKGEGVRPGWATSVKACRSCPGQWPPAGIRKS